MSMISSLSEGEKKVVSLLIKSDVHGSSEALSDALISSITKRYRLKLLALVWEE